RAIHQARDGGNRTRFGDSAGAAAAAGGCGKGSDPGHHPQGDPDTPLSNARTNHRGTEDTEGRHTEKGIWKRTRPSVSSSLVVFLCVFSLCVLCASVVRFSRSF